MHYNKINDPRSSSPKPRLILVAPLYSGNIGSTARAAANFDIDDIVLVNPQCDPRNDEARMMATGHAATLLAKIRVVDTLSEAIGDCSAAVALTRRQGAMRQPELGLDEIPRLVSAGQVALVFGREDSGLTQKEVQSCTHITSIPSSEAMPSLNLSHAVAVVLAGLFKSLSSPPESREVISVAAYSALLEHLKQTMLAIDLTSNGNPDRLLAIMGQGLKRARLSHQEAQAFHGFLKHIEKTPRNS